MPHFLQDLDLSRNAFDVLLVPDPGLLQDFDGHALASQNVLGHLHLAECTLAQIFAEHVVPEFRACGVLVELGFSRLFFCRRDRCLCIAV